MVGIRHAKPRLFFLIALLATFSVFHHAHASPLRGLRAHSEAVDIKKALHIKETTLAPADRFLPVLTRWMREPPAFQRTFASLAVQVLKAQRSRRGDPPHDYRQDDADIYNLLRPYNESWGAWVEEISDTMQGNSTEGSPKRPVEHYMCRTVGFLWIASILLFLLAMLLGLIVLIGWCCNLWSQTLTTALIVVWITSMLCYTIAAVLSFTYLILSLAQTDGPLQRAFDGKKNDDPPCMVTILFCMIVVFSMIYHWCLTGCIHCCAFTHQAYEGRQDRLRQEELQRQAEIEARKELPKLVLTLRVESSEASTALLTFHTLAGREVARVSVQPRQTIRELWSELATAAGAEEWQLCLVPASSATGKTVNADDDLIHSGTVSDLLAEFGLNSLQG